MNAYIIERYDAIHGMFLYGWLLWAAIFIVALGFLFDSDSPLQKHNHLASIRYSTILFIIITCAIGLLGTMFLPSPELVTAWLS